MAPPQLKPVLKRKASEAELEDGEVQSDEGAPVGAKKQRVALGQDEQPAWVNNTDYGTEGAAEENPAKAYEGYCMRYCSVHIPSRDMLTSGRYFNNDRFSNFTVKIDSESITVHKVVLCQHSQAFRARIDWAHAVSAAPSLYQRVTLGTSN